MADGTLEHRFSTIQIIQYKNICGTKQEGGPGIIIARILHEYEIPPMNNVVHDKKIIEDLLTNNKVIAAVHYF